MGLFSKKKVYVASTTLPLVLGEEDAVKNSTINAVLDNASVVDGIMDSALNGTGVRLNSAYAYGRDYYSLGLPEGTNLNIQIDRAAIQGILEGIHSGPVKVNFVTVDYGNADLLIDDFLRNTRQVDNGSVGVPPSHLLTERTNQLNTELVSLDGSVHQAEIDTPEVTTTSSSSTDENGTVTVIDVTETVSRTSTVSVVPGTASGDAVLNVQYVDATPSGTFGYNCKYTYTITLNVTKTYDVSSDVVTETVTTTTTTPTNGNTTVTVETVTVNSTEAEVSPVTLTTVTGGTYNEPVSFGSKALDLYYHANYEVEILGGWVQRNWSYRVKDNTHPLLAPDIVSTLPTPFLPIVPIRRHNTDLTDEVHQSTALYVTSRRLLKKLGIDINDLADSINENPDIDDVDHAYVYMGAQLQSDNSQVIRYLSRFFDYLSTLSTTSKTAFDEWEAREPIHVDGPEGGYYVDPPITAPQRDVLRIADDALTLELRYNYIAVNTVTGSIGTVGTVTRTTTVLPAATLSDGATAEAISVSLQYEQSYITFREQLSATEYKEIVVHGLTHTNYVYRDKTVETSLEDSTDPDDDNFMIPLHIDILKQFTLLQRNEIGNHTINIVFNSYEIVKVKWYQTALFRFIITAVAMYFGAGNIANSLTAITSATTINAALSIILKMVFKALLFRFGFKFATKLLGDELALMLAIIAAVYLGTQGAQNGSLKGVPWAEELLMVITGLSQGVQANIKDDMEGLLKEQSLFEDDKNEKEDALKSAQELLETSDIIDPFVFTKVDIYFDPDESAEAFYNRTIHSGNIGVLALDAVSNYVNTMLQLPETKTSGEKIGF